MKLKLDNYLIMNISHLFPISVKCCTRFMRGWTCFSRFSRWGPLFMPNFKLKWNLFPTFRDNFGREWVNIVSALLRYAKLASKKIGRLTNYFIIDMKFCDMYLERRDQRLSQIAWNIDHYWSRDLTNDHSSLRLMIQ